MLVGGRTGRHTRVVLRSWLPHVVGGGLLASVFAVLLGLGAAENRTRSGEPTALPVNEASGVLAAGGALPHVWLVDLVVDCEDAVVAERRLFALGRTAEAEWPIVLVPVREPGHCQAVAGAPIGAVERASAALEHEADVPMGSLRLDPYEPYGWALVVCAGMVGAGALLVRAGLRRRRSNAALLQRLLARPIVPEVVPRPGGSYRGGEPEPFLLSRPLRLDRDWSRGRRVAGMAAIGVGLVSVALLGHWLRELVHLRAVWHRGMLAPEVELVEVQRDRLFGLHSETLLFTYTDAQGGRHLGDYWRLAVSAMPALPLSVRYDGDEPDAAALSLAAEGVESEFVALALVSLMALGGAWLGRRFVRSQWAQIRRVREVLHSGPEEILLKVLNSPRADHESGIAIWELETPEGRVIEERFEAGELPFFLVPFGSEALAVRKPGDPDGIVVLRDDLAPLLVDADEVARVRGRWRDLTGEGNLPPNGRRRRR